MEWWKLAKIALILSKNRVIVSFWGCRLRQHCRPRHSVAAKWARTMSRCYRRPAAWRKWGQEEMLKLISDRRNCPRPLSSIFRRISIICSRVNSHCRLIASQMQLCCSQCKLAVLQRPCGYLAQLDFHVMNQIDSQIMSKVIKPLRQGLWCDLKLNLIFVCD